MIQPEGGRAHLRPAQRMRRPTEFREVYARGRRIGNEMFAAHILANGTDSARLGLSIAVRATGGAVRRNRMRRLIRESFRLRRATLPALDIIVSLRAPARGASAGELRGALERLWQRMAAP
ncbi:MAG: ribonuclease P protein component [Gammaproteobacteria bacterium]|nr:ribonuclease P protein component [Gammaproteobacteria bacterium]